MIIIIIIIITIIIIMIIREPIVSSPFANVFSISDGQPGVWSSGVPYIYSMPLELSFIDLLEVTRVRGRKMSTG